jgi:hypothetical protein
MTRTLAALVAATTLVLSGCTTSSDGPAEASGAEPASTDTSKEASTPEPVSESAVQAGYGRSYRVAQEISGVVSWEVQPGPGVTNATARKIGAAADAFITEHLLRADRLQGKYAVKTGEMDALREKFAPKLFKSTSTHIDWWAANEEKWGRADNWPKKLRSQTDAHARSIGAMFITQPLVSDGKGQIRNEMKRRVIYTSGGDILAYIDVTGRRANNTGSIKDVIAKISLQKVDGRWLIDGVHWDIT